MTYNVSSGTLSLYTTTTQSRTSWSWCRTQNRRSQSRENFRRSRSRLGLKIKSFCLRPQRLVYIPVYQSKNIRIKQIKPDKQ